MNEYELNTIFKITVQSEQLQKAKDRINKILPKHGGIELRRVVLGEKLLAYPIAKELKGSYERLHFLGTGALVDALEQQLRILPEVLRFLTVRVDRDVDLEQKKKEHAEAAARDAEQSKEATEEAASA